VESREAGERFFVQIHEQMISAHDFPTNHPGPLPRRPGPIIGNLAQLGQLQDERAAAVQRRLVEIWTVKRKHKVGG